MNRNFLYTLFKRPYVQNSINIFLFPISLGILLVGNKKSFVATYHLIERKLTKGSFNNAIAIRQKTFELQISILRWLGYDFISPCDLTVKKGVLITIDDGYSATYNSLLELNLMPKIPILNFICPGFYLDKEIKPWWYELEDIILGKSFDLARLKSVMLVHGAKTSNVDMSANNDPALLYNNLRASLIEVSNQVREAILSGYSNFKDIERQDYRGLFMDEKALLSGLNTTFSYGAHTYSHIALKAEDLAIINRELDECDAQIQRAVGLAVTSFAYPYGIESPRAIVREKLAARYSQIYTTRYGFIDSRTDLKSIPRISLSESDGILGFINKISGSYSFLYRLFNGSA
jgi:peptidoglycan/xylan/chitin deacetylase (PgdA/CDA1 family)